MSFIGGSRVLVTGCAGFIGKHLTTRLRELGASVTGIDERPVSQDGLAASFVADITAPLENLDCPQIDIAVHLAAITGVERASRDPLKTFSVNLLGTMNVLRLARRLGARQFCLLSSSEVYGEAREQPVAETARLQPRSAYGLSKQAAEAALALTAGEEFHGIVIRPFNVYGPGQREDFVVSRFFKDSFTGVPHAIVGDGKQRRTFTYVDDLVTGVVLSLERSRNTFNVFNIAGECPTSVESLAEEIDAIAGHRVPRVFRAPPHLGRPLAAEIHTRVPSIAKARSELGYEPRFSLKEGLQLTFEHLASAVSF